MSMFNFFHKKREPQQLWFKTDIHCHILPGIDDGSPSVEKSLELVGHMQDWGIERIFASPHVTYGTFPNTPDTVAAARESLQKALDADASTLKLGNSAEYRIDDLFLENLANGKMMTLPSDYLLVENSFMQEPWNLDQLLFDLQVKGFKPILVHPERYSYYYNKRNRYKEIHDGGTMLQINVLSLAGHYGKSEKEFAEYLISQGLVDFVGTDLHNMGHVEAITRYLTTRDFEKHRRALEGKILNDTL